jgi:hypothetical protein
MNFNVNNLVRFQIRKSKNILRDFISHTGIEYSYFRTNKTVNPDIVVNIGKFVPKNSGCYIVDDKYHLKHDYIYYKDSHKIAKWEVEISGFEGNKIIINVDCNAFGYLFFESVLQFFVSFVMCRKKCAMIHSFSVSKGDDCFFFPGRSGVGKTISSMYFMEKGYDFLGDNFTILAKKKIISFPTPLMVFKYNLKESVKKVLDSRTKMIIYLKYILYKLTMGYAKFYTPVPVENIIKDRIRDQAKLNSVILMISASDYSVKKVREQELIDRLVSIDKFEFLSMKTELISYAFLFPNSRLANHWSNLRKCVKENIRGVPCYQMTVPKNYTYSLFEKIYKFVEGLI